MTMRIVLVDDNPGDRELAARVLRREYTNAEFVPVVSAEDFMRVLAEDRFDLVITDYQFRWSNGVALLKMVKEHYPDVPVVMFTATGTQEVAVEAMKEGLDDYVVKSPRHVERLAVAARVALERATQRRRLRALEAERNQLLAETQAAERRARFLADASMRLAAALEYQATLRELAQLLIGELADWCFIDVTGRDGQVRRLAAAYRDPAKAELARQLEHVLPTPDDPNDQVGAVLRSGKTLLLPQVPAELIAAASVRPEQQELLQQLNIQSVLVVALQARGQILGAVSLVSSDAMRLFSTDDRLLVEDLVARASLALDNARLYTAEQRQRQRTEQLQAITAALIEASTAANVARVLVEQSTQSLGATSGAYLSLTDDGTALATTYSIGVASQLLDMYPRIPLETPSLVADVVRSGEPIAIETWDAWAARYPQLAMLPDETRWQTIVAVPVAINSTKLGALVLAYNAVHEMTPQDRALLLTIARQGAIAMGRVRLYEAERQARAEAEAAVQLRDQFLSVAAHELRTPLTSLLGNAELMQRRVQQDSALTARHQRNMQVIIEQARRLNRLIVALLDLSRLQSGVLTLERTTLELRGLIEQVLEEAQPLLAGYNIQHELPQTPVLVEGDELRLAQVVYNLLSNAVKYSLPGSKVQLRLATDDSTARLLVTDQGIGVPAEAVPHLFQRFFRAANVDPRQINGMGVGLYVVREIVARHGGTVGVESEEGKGSTFWIALPLAHDLA
jgi:signal transduction histidine kinase/DNA-binding response OmpR family regulator